MTPTPKAKLYRVTWDAFGEAERTYVMGQNIARALGIFLGGNDPSMVDRVILVEWVADGVKVDPNPGGIIRDDN